MAQILRSCSRSRPLGESSVSPCPKPVNSRTSKRKRKYCSASILSGPFASRLAPARRARMHSFATAAKWRGRLALGLLLVPTVLWLGALIVFPHIDLAVLSFRERVG